MPHMAYHVSSNTLARVPESPPSTPRPQLSVVQAGHCVRTDVGAPFCRCDRKPTEGRASWDVCVPVGARMRVKLSGSAPWMRVRELSRQARLKAGATIASCQGRRKLGLLDVWPVAWGKMMKRWGEVQMGEMSSDGDGKAVVVEVEAGYVLPNRTAFCMASTVTVWGRWEFRYWAMVCASSMLIGFADTLLAVLPIQGVCSHVRRLKNARDVGRQKDSSVRHVSV